MECSVSPVNSGPPQRAIPPLPSTIPSSLHSSGTGHSSSVQEGAANIGAGKLQVENKNYPM